MAVVWRPHSWRTNPPDRVQIIHLNTSRSIQRLTFTGRVHELAFTDDSRRLVTGNASGTIYVLRLDD